MTTRKITAIPAIEATIDGSVLTLSFSNGRTIIVDAAALSTDIQQAAKMHGLKQKLVDGAAIARNPDTGLSATIDDKYQAVLEIAERIRGQSATWNKVRATGEGASIGASNLIVRALVKLTGKSVSDIKAFVDAKTKEEKAALRKNAKVAAIILELQMAEADTSDIDSDALLGQLDMADTDEADTDEADTDEADTDEA